MVYHVTGHCNGAKQTTPADRVITGPISYFTPLIQLETTMAWFKIKDGQLRQCSKRVSDKYWNEMFDQEGEPVIVAYDHIPNGKFYDGEEQTSGLCTKFQGYGDPTVPQTFHTEMDTGEGTVELARYATATIAMIGHRAILELIKSQGLKAVLQEHFSFIAYTEVANG